jgi:hypothetical protein
MAKSVKLTQASDLSLLRVLKKTSFFNTPKFGKNWACACGNFQHMKGTVELRNRVKGSNEKALIITSY